MRGEAIATRHVALLARTEELQLTKVRESNPGQEESCAATVLDHFTSAFHWAEYNIAAIWLRNQWYLMTNSVLSDVQNGGLTFIRYHWLRNQIAAMLYSAQWNADVKWSSTVAAQLSSWPGLHSRSFRAVVRSSVPYHKGNVSRGDCLPSHAGNSDRLVRTSVSPDPERCS